MELLGKSREELRALSAEMGEPAYRGDQLYGALYAERVFDLAQVTNLPGAFRERLATETPVTLPTGRQRYRSTDGSVRYLLGLGDKKDFTAENPHRAEKQNPSLPASLPPVS